LTRRVDEWPGGSEAPPLGKKRLMRTGKVREKAHVKVLVQCGETGKKKEKSNRTRKLWVDGTVPREEAVFQRE